ncbi:MAG: class I mannose-6-phosphate isomerase [Bacteroidaceae bacterium]|nr:class I mannose-6-phosphate isomerase [Bacteroidaceae bacterium]
MNKTIKRPLRFRPYYKQVIWGGSRIADYKQEDIPMTNVGESWEISAVPGHESFVTDDVEFDGMSICQLIDIYGEDFLGTEVQRKYGSQFPLLIKIIDAHSNLSVHVHPDDRLAMQRHDSRGKSEMWYVLGATADSRIYCGLSAPLDADTYERCVEDDSIMEYITTYRSAPRQFYFVPPGTVHAIGAGNLIAEIQETSDITYRIYDYNRTEADGTPRQLHTAEARAAINYAYPNVAMPTSCVFDYTRRNAISTENFQVDFLMIRTEDSAQTVDTEGRSFAILMVTEGSLDIHYGHDIATCRAGVTLLIPACMGEFELHGCATALLVHC